MFRTVPLGHRQGTADEKLKLRQWLPKFRDEWPSFETKQLIGKHVTGLI